MDQNAMLDFFFPENASDHPTMWWELQVYVRVRVREAGEFVFDKAGVHPKFRPLRGWGRSSVGRAPQWHCGGQGFESPRLHHPFLKRSEEHTSELQSPYVISYAVFCLKKN